MTDKAPERWTTRLRRSLRRLVVGVLVGVMLVVSYFGWWCFHHYNRPFGGEPTPYPNIVLPDWVFAPLEEYAESERPGSDLLGAASVWSGSRFYGTFQECLDLVVIVKAAAKSHDDRFSDDRRSGEYSPSSDTQGNASTDDTGSNP